MLRFVHTGCGVLRKARIPRRRHRLPREDPREEITRVGRKDVGVSSESESASVSVSESWNAGLTRCEAVGATRHRARGRRRTTQRIRCERTFRAPYSLYNSSPITANMPNWEFGSTLNRLQAQPYNTSMAYCEQLAYLYHRHKASVIRSRLMMESYGNILLIH